jgi:hypothetical protein
MVDARQFRRYEPLEIKSRPIFQLKITVSWPCPLLYVFSETFLPILGDWSG